MADDKQIGTRFQVHHVVSEGPRATVLKAFDTKHEGFVALKKFPLVDGDRDALLAEARVLEAITPHPALPVTDNSFIEDGHYVLVMDWVEGSNLQELLEAQGDPGLPLSDVIDDLTQVADVLDHLHADRPPIVHGDVKPSNIIRTPSGRVVLVDFDIASAHGDPRDHRDPCRIGTIGYVAPEVMAGDQPGPPADVYGLAATAMALLSGRPPDEPTLASTSFEALGHGHVGRVLRQAMATDPQKRPLTARRLIDSLGTGGRLDLPSGVVAFLAAEIVDAGRLWEQDPDETPVTVSRLGDVRDEIVLRSGGHVFVSMNDATMIAFRDASAAAACALEFHDRVRVMDLPPGFDIQLRVAIAVGEATLRDGTYTGAVVDHVLRLRSAAEPGTTITSEPTAELLVGLVGRDMSIVPLGRAMGTALPPGTPIFALARPGDEPTGADRTVGPDSTDPTVRPAAEPFGHSPDPSSAHDDSVTTAARWAAVTDALEHPSTLIPITIMGLALIYEFVLSSEFGMSGAAFATLVIAAVAAVGSFGWHYSRAHATRRKAILDAEREREDAARIRTIEVERAETRHRIQAGFGHLPASEGREGSAAIEALASEFDATVDLLARRGREATMSATALLPDLIDETYRRGVSALSDALDQLESASGKRRRRLEMELIEIEGRLRDDGYPDAGSRNRDEQRRKSHRQLLDRYDQNRTRAAELVFEAERCSAAIAEARLELASSRVDDAQIDVDAVVETLEQTIRRVRRVQEAFRKLGR